MSRHPTTTASRSRLRRRTRALVVSTALGFNQNGSDNTATGSEALLFNHGQADFNSAYGYQALRNNAGTSNTATGTQALLDNTSGDNNVADGVNALLSNTTEGDNTAVGTEALFLEHRRAERRRRAQLPAGQHDRGLQPRPRLASWHQSDHGLEQHRYWQLRQRGGVEGDPDRDEGNPDPRLPRRGQRQDGVGDHRACPHQRPGTARDGGGFGSNDQDSEHQLGYQAQGPTSAGRTRRSRR